jgi:WD40-like Beta Propeller Repeat
VVVTRFAPALVVLPLAALVAAGCGGASRSTSPSAGCSVRSDASSSSDLLWLGGKRPLVYYVHGHQVISSSGRATALPRFAIPVGFRARSKPLVLNTVGDELQATALASGPKTLTLGRDAVVTPAGRIVSYRGARIGYVGGSSFVARGLPLKWRITSVAASPRDPHMFLVAAESPEAGIETCGKGLGAIYRVSPTATRTIFVDNPCRDHPQAAWSPDGSTIAYVGGPSSAVYTLDSSGAHLRRVTADGRVVRYLWSPGGTSIAYVTKCGGAAVVSLASGRVHALGQVMPLAWSPNGRELAVATAGRPLIEAVSASGNSSRVLLRLSRS